MGIFAEKTKDELNDIGESFYGAGDCLLATQRHARMLAGKLDKVYDALPPVTKEMSFNDYKDVVNEIRRILKD